MKTTENYLEEIKEIRKIMEQSGRFLSLSGLSGVLIGIYALIGAYITYRIIYLPPPSVFQKVFAGDVVYQLIIIAMIVLFVSFATTLWLTWQKAKNEGKKIWNHGSRQMLFSLAIPFISGGILILTFTFRGFYEIISSACLIFYGLALVNAAKFTRQEIFYLGLSEISLGILAALFPGTGLIFWALGFGVLHIIYGSVMYFRYDRPSK
jgi:hypothetical protein